MERRCARPACNARAAATFNFDGLRRVVWISALDQSGRSAGNLCADHADRLSVPRHWELRDLRTDEERLAARSGALPLVAPAARPTPARLSPNGARTPLLARAFRAASA